MNENRCAAIPWFLIARQAVRGSSLETLSVKFQVSVEEIRRHLDRALVATPEGQLRVRTNAEINQASARARNDLVSILLEAIDELAVSQCPRLTQLREFNDLLAAAGRLFQWPTLTATRVMQSGAMPVTSYAANVVTASTSADSPPSDGAPTTAVNLALIATTPEQLAVLAKNQEKFSGVPESNSQPNGNGIAP